MCTSQDERAPRAETLVAASCVAFAADAPAEGCWSGVLLRAPPGGGKSSFALMLIALGARLVSDDQTSLSRDPRAQTLFAAAPPAIAGLIEARGLGILRLAPLKRAPLRWVVDIAPAAERLPPLRRAALLGLSVPALTLPATPQSAAALACLARGGALIDPDAAPGGPQSALAASRR